MPRLTKRFVDSVGRKAAGRTFFDEDLPGFGLRVRASGRRCYVVKYRARGRQRWMTLGLHGALTAEQARRRAARVLAAAREGADPAAEARAAVRAATVADLAARYLAQHAEVKKKPASLRNDRLILRLHVLPKLGRLSLPAVTRADVTALHHAMRDTPTMANRVLALLSKMFTLAERWGVRPDGSNPCRHVERYRETRRERFLSEAELARLGEALADAERLTTETPSAVAALRLLVFTGCRVSEVLGLRWEWVDLERRCLRLPDSKTGAKTVPVNAPALAVLSNLARVSEWVIPGRDPALRFVNLAKPWARMRRSAGLQGVRLHDLRHSFAAVAAGSGHSLLVIGGLLGHAHAATTKRYAHLADDPLRSASEAVGARMAAALAGPDMKRGNVAVLRRGSGAA